VPGGDFEHSPERRSHLDRSVHWHRASADSLPVATDSFDRVICFSVWPHLGDEHETARELLRVLKPGGKMHIWHLISRMAVHDIHAAASHVVAGDVLKPADDVSRILAEVGFRLWHSEDTETRCLITASKREMPDE